MFALGHIKYQIPIKISIFMLRVKFKISIHVEGSLNHYFNFFNKSNLSDERISLVRNPTKETGDPGKSCETVVAWSGRSEWDDPIYSVIAIALLVKQGASAVTLRDFQ